MRALFINAVCGIRSTGRICTDLAQELETQGYEVKIAYSREAVPDQYKKYAVRIGNNLDVYWHALMTKLFDNRGYWSRRATKKFVKWANEYNPDLLWLHNIHDYVINIDMLFEWIKSRPDMQVKWTQHDCWAFTGGCMHYTENDCKQWMKLCNKCPEKAKKDFLPLMHKTRVNYVKKKALFSGINNMTIIAPSKWMAKQVGQSFLNRYPVKVINNKIDENIFKPTYGDFRKKYNLENKIIILGVASSWSRSKGLYDYYKISSMLGNPYCVVLVGLTKRQIKKLPNNMLGISRTESKKELAEIYTAADVFVNLTYADTYPTVNIEARSCGTKIITYDTGGSPESAGKESVVVSRGDIKRTAKAIEDIIK